MAKKSKTNGNAAGKAPVDRVERWPITKLAPYLQNPRAHSEEQIGQIAASMKEFGQAQLIVVDEQGEIIAGHGRLLAAAQLGWPSVMVGVAIGWTEMQKRAYRIADNKIALGSTWDDALLKLEAGALSMGGFDFSLLGFDNKEWAKLINGGAILNSDEQLANLSFAVIVRCDDELHQKTVIEQLAVLGLRIEALIS